MTEPAPVTRAAASGLTIAGFVIAIIAVLLSFAGGIGFIPGAVGACLSVAGERRSKSSLGAAGFILGVIAVVLSLAITFMQATASGH